MDNVNDNMATTRRKQQQNNTRQRKTPSDTAQTRAQNSESFITFNLF
jgi:hypothetical protein